MLISRGGWRYGGLAVLFAHFCAGCFAVKIDPGDTITTIGTITDTLPNTISDTLTATGPTTAGPTTEPPTTTGPTTEPPTTTGPTTDTTTTVTTTTFTSTTIGPTTDTITIGPASDTIDPTFTVTTEPPSDCGNGVVEAGEECDDGNAVDTDDCPTTCKNPFCGDKFVRAGFEVCDDGLNDNSYEGCAPGCSGLGPRCGDGVLQGAEGELCDDGNQTPGDGCSGCVTENLPPECVQAKALASPTRNVAIQSDDVACDLDLPEEGQWSRFVGSAGKKMPTSAPPEFACGTHAPGWLNGPEPAEADGTVARQVCFHWEGNTCEFSVPIAVKHCGPFLIYRLPTVPTCALRYCGTD